MKAIPDSVYEALTTHQRVRAAVSAEARGDDAEVERLKRTCGRETYSITDPAYSDTMQGLMSLSLAIETDLRGLALSMLQAAKQPQADDYLDLILEEAASVAAAWGRLMAEWGIDPREMEKAGAPRHPCTGALLKLSAGMENPNQVERCLKAFREVLAC